MSPAAAFDGADLGRTEGIHYDSPSFGGLTVGLTYGFKDRTAPQLGGVAAGTDAHFSANVRYAAGPLTVLAGYMQNRHDEDAVVVGVGYNLGVANLKFAIHDVDGGKGANPADFKAYQLSADVPLGATVVSVGYLNTKTNGVKSHKVGLGAQYNLSKRTAFIATYGKAKNTKANFDLSLRHTF